ncbi:MAG: DUF4340 domain-containing protein [Verrucomicrobia bacterium]|nr:DUF4340 domain-containing protein [Verrucomicrobiota bacterium]
MRTKVTLILIFLNVALFFFIFKFERNWRTEAASLEARRRVLGTEAGDIRTLEVTSAAAGGSFGLVRTRDTWLLTKPLDWPANPHAVSSIVNELQLLEHETSFRVVDLAQTKQSLTDYGLDKAKITVAFSSGDPAAGANAARPKTLLRIGDTTKDGKRVYVLSPNGERVHVVGRTLIDRLSLPLDQLRADTLLTIPVFEARSLSVQTANPDQTRGSGAAGVRVRIRRDGARWTFETPIIARAGKSAVELTINDLNALHAKTFNPPSPATAPSATPALRIMLEGNNRYETLFLGAAVPPAGGGDPSAQPAASVEYYAQLDGRNALFTVVVPVLLVDTLRNAQESLREKRILDFDTQAVTAITLAAPVQPGAPLTLQRLEATAGATADAAPRWQIIQRGEGALGPQTLPADRAAVQRLFEQLTLLSADKFTSDAPTSADLESWGFNRPEREITLTFAGNITPVVLRLGTDASRSVVYARVGTPVDPGTSIYAVKIDVRRELPIEASEWRDRSLREPLPPGARFTALKVSDVDSRQLVFETTFNAAGEPASPPRDPKAVQDVLAQLRTLRAKRILPAGFADRVSVAGDERPWRFQLEATLSLPGGGGVEQTGTLILFLTERLGGAQQFAGSRELNAIFEIEQPFVDALWALIARDPGPPPATAETPTARSPNAR